MPVWRLQGISRDAWKRYSSERSWGYEGSNSGFKHNLADPQASLGLCQRTCLESMRQRRAVQTAGYEAGPSYLHQFEPGAVRNDIRQTGYQCPTHLRLEPPGVGRAEVIDQLKARGVSPSGTSLSCTAAFVSELFDVKTASSRVADATCGHSVSLPLYTQVAGWAMSSSGFAASPSATEWLRSVNLQE